MENKEEKVKENNNPPKKWKKILIIVVIVLIIITACFGIWYFLSKEDSKEKKNQYSYKFEFGDKSGKKIILYNNQNNYPILLTHDNIEESGVINKKHAYYGKNIYIILEITFGIYYHMIPIKYYHIMNQKIMKL